METAGLWAALVLSAAIGLSLGLIGGGGSIITVPVLVYVAGVPVKQAIGLSLAIVGTTAAVGALFKARQGEVDLYAAVLFGITGMVGAAGGARVTRLVPSALLMLLFAALMVIVGLRMLRSGAEQELPEKSECSVWRCGLAGLGVGALTGFLGVGGGFLLVPALLHFARMPMHRTIGTSLAIITLNSASGFLAHRGELPGGMGLAGAFTAASVVGVLGGTALSRRIHPAGLRTAFGGLTLAVAAYLTAMNIGPLMGWIAHRG